MKKEINTEDGVKLVEELKQDRELFDSIYFVIMSYNKVENKKLNNEELMKLMSIFYVFLSILILSKKIMLIK